MLKSSFTMQIGTPRLRVVLYCTILALTPLYSISQDILWERSFGGKHADYLYDVQPTADYGFIIGGSSLSEKAGTKSDPNKGDYDYWIWKMNESGELDWQRSFGGSGTDLLKSIRVTTDGGFLLAGTSNSKKSADKRDDNVGGNDFWIIKLDAAGVEQWQKTIGGEDNDEFSVVYQTKEGGYVIGGTSSSEPAGSKQSKGFGGSDYWIVKLSSKGDIEWEKTYGGQKADILTDIRPTKDGGFIVGGYSNSPYSGTKTEKCWGPGDFWILKLSEKGDLEWQKTYGGDKDDWLSVILQLPDGNYVAGGYSNSPTGHNRTVSSKKGSDIWLIKLDAEGNSIWQESYNYGNGDILTSITPNTDGSFLVTGYAKSEVYAADKKDKKEINDYIAIKIDEKGEVKWEKIIGSDGEDILRRAVETRDGGYILAGTSNGKPSRDKSSGQGRNDFWLVKLKDKDKKKKSPEIIEAIPNPALEFTNVIVGYEYERGTASVYDLGGKLIGSFQVSGRTIPVSLNGLPEGIYIIQVKTEKSTDSVKVIKGISN